MRHLILKEIYKISKERGVKSDNIKVYIILIFRLIHLGFNHMISRYYLRNVNLLGRFVFIRRKPTIVNKGHMQIGNLVRIWSNINPTRLAVHHGGRLIIGEKTFVNGPMISASAEISIGKNCLIGPQTIIMDSDFHGISDTDSIEGESAPIIIEDNVWLGTRTMILKGVHIGEGAIVYCGSYSHQKCTSVHSGCRRSCKDSQIFKPKTRKKREMNY